MSSYATVFTVLLVLALLFVNNYYSNSMIVEAKQPLPFHVDSTLSIQPIIENAESPIEYRYTRTIKFYYVDKLPKPIPTVFVNDPITSYCSDSTQVILETEKGIIISRYSVKRMSCQILAVVNFEAADIDALMESKTKKLVIRNIVTENKYVYLLNTDYFQKNLIRWRR